MTDIPPYLPPQNLEAEESIIASCLLHPESVDQALDILSPDDFYRTAHQKIFKAIKTLHKKSIQPDMVSVVSYLRDAGQLDEVGGASYIANFPECIPIAVNIVQYSQFVKQKSQARKFIEIAHSGIERIYQSNGNITEVLDNVQAEIMRVGLDIKTEKFTLMRDLTMQSMERYESLMSRERDTGIKTGFPSIDSLTGGLFGSKLVIIAARPKIGKTALAIAMTRNMAKSGHKVGFFELEMDKEAIDDRWMAMECGVNSMCFSTGTGPSKAQWPMITEAADRKYQWPIIIDDTGGQTIFELKRRIRKMVNMGCEIIFVDQLSKIRATDSRRGSWENNTEHVIELKQATKELKTPIVLLVQLNRDVEKRKPPVPTAADFKLTGAIEEEADIAFLGYRRYPYTENPNDLNHAWWHLALHRGGPTRKILMHWEPKTTLFTEGIG